MASPDSQKCECTTAPQSHQPEIQAPSLVRGECTSRRKKEEREEEEREKEEKEEERDVQYNKQNLTQGVRKNMF